MFYYEEFFRTALAGIDRSAIMPATVQIGQVILLITFLVAVYESYIRGGDVRMLGTAGAKYVALGHQHAQAGWGGVVGVEPEVLRSMCEAGYA